MPGKARNKFAGIYVQNSMYAAPENYNFQIYFLKLKEILISVCCYMLGWRRD